MVRRSAVLFVVAAVLGGCSSQTPATSTPEPTQSPTASTPGPQPSPTPVDVAAVALPQLAKATSGKLTITGTIDAGTNSGTVSGTIDFAGSDSDQVFTVAAGGAPVTTETIHAAGVGYTKKGPGPWFQDAVAPASGKGMSNVLGGLSALTDAGTETRNGVLVHRLELPAGTILDPAAFGITDPTYIGPAVSLVFYASEAGKPVSMVVTVTWTQTVGTQSLPVKMVLEMAFDQLGGSVSVLAPGDVWVVYTSKRYHLRIAMLGDWDTDTTAKGIDYLVSPGDPFVGVDRFASRGISLNTWAKASIAYDKSHFKFMSNGNVGYTLAGVKARLLTFHATINHKKVVVYDVIGIKSGYVYEVYWQSPAGQEAGDLALLKAMLATFAFN